MPGHDTTDRTPITPGPAEHTEEDTDMTAVLDTTTIEHLPEVDLTADALDALDAVDDIDIQIRSELEFLTSLVWAPDTAAGVHALVGDHQHRATTAGQPHDRIPLTHLHTLFLHPVHARLFATLVELVDEGTPVSPAILGTRAGLADRTLRPTLLAIAAPTGHGPLPGGTDVPHLARGIVDAYYRRGYTALISRMTHALAEADTDALAGHWATLTEHQQTAERRRLAVTDALAAL